MIFDAIILAGGKLSPEDPLYLESPDGFRSLITVHSKPMVQWVIDALSACDLVGDLYVAGLTSKHNLTSTKTIHYLPDEGGIFENIQAGVLQSAKDHPSQFKVILASSDIPAIRPEMIQWLAEQVIANPDPLLYYNVVSRPTMETRYPNSNRSFLHFKDISVCGGDLNVVDSRLFEVERPIWKALTESRKNALKQAGMFGFDTLILVALHLITLEKAVAKVCKKLSLQGQALVCPYAELAMDADKPHQLAILREDLGRPL